MCVWGCGGLGLGGVLSDVVKTHPQVEHDHNGVVKRRNTSPPRMKWQGWYDDHLESWAGWGVFWRCAGGLMCMHGSEKLVKNHHANQCERFQNRRETKQSKHTQLLLWCFGCIILLATLSVSPSDHTVPEPHHH